MWPIILRVAQRYAPYVTLPVAGFIGFLGYNLENYFSDKYTPYSEPIKETRKERLLSDEILENAGQLSKLKLSGSALEKNVSPSLK